uniref:C2H2-type domain-containing protein n=1 Tax=Neogobius melanostomus TaxID=47308 RepID=A0A8C6SFC4_9GOBI
MSVSDARIGSGHSNSPFIGGEGRGGGGGGLQLVIQKTLLWSSMPPISHCNLSFGLLSNLRTHQHIHTGEKKHHCNQCGKAFLQQSNLKQHKLTHSKRSFPCDECGKLLSSKSGFEQHKRMHSGHDVHCCETCGKASVASNQPAKPSSDQIPLKPLEIRLQPVQM